MFKLLKAIVLVGAGLGALGLLRPSWETAALDLLDQLALSRDRRMISALATQVLPLMTAATPRRLLEVALGSFIYGSVFLVEAAGLWFRKRWAEYLTTIVTASLLPLEMEALLHRQTAPRALTLALNIAVLFYLVWRLRNGRLRKPARLKD